MKGSMKVEETDSWKKGNNHVNQVQERNHAATSQHGDGRAEVKVEWPESKTATRPLGGGYVVLVGHCLARDDGNGTGRGQE